MSETNLYVRNDLTFCDPLKLNYSSRYLVSSFPICFKTSHRFSLNDEIVLERNGNNTSRTTVRETPRVSSLTTLQDQPVGCVTKDVNGLTTRRDMRATGDDCLTNGLMEYV